MPNEGSWGTDMPPRPVNDYSKITVDWFLGDEGDVMDHIQGKLVMPLEFDPRKARLFLEYLQLGMTVRQACTNVPVLEKLIITWKRGSYASPPNFVAAYKIAEAQQAHSMAQETIDIADGTDRITSEITTKAVDSVKNPFKRGNEERFNQLRDEMLTRIGNRIATRKWIASKMLPNIYGEKLNLEHTGDVKKPVGLDLKNLTTEQLEAIAKLEEELKGVSGS